MFTTNSHIPVWKDHLFGPIIIKKIAFVILKFPKRNVQA